MLARFDGLEPSGELGRGKRPGLEGRSTLSVASGGGDACDTCSTQTFAGEPLLEKLTGPTFALDELFAGPSCDWLILDSIPGEQQSVIPGIGTPARFAMLEPDLPTAFTFIALPGLGGFRHLVEVSCPETEPGETVEAGLWAGDLRITLLYNGTDCEISWLGDGSPESIAADPEISHLIGVEIDADEIVRWIADGVVLDEHPLSVLSNYADQVATIGTYFTAIFSRRDTRTPLIGRSFFECPRAAPRGAPSWAPPIPIFASDGFPLFDTDSRLILAAI